MMIYYLAIYFVTLLNQRQLGDEVKHDVSNHHRDDTNYQAYLGHVVYSLIKIMQSAVRLHGV